MKKYAKILSILLCLSMLVGMIAMVATAEETTDTNSSEVVYEAFKSADIGYYDSEGNFVSHIWAANVSGASLIDGVTESSGGNEGASGHIPLEEHVANGGDKQLAVLFATGDEPITMNGLEVVYSQEKYRMVDFKIQVKTEKDGDWVTVYEDKDVTYDEDVVVNYMFDTVTAYEVRFLIDEVISKWADGVATKTIVAMREVSPWVVTEVEAPTEPEAPVGSTRLEIVSPKRLTTVFGKYTDGTGDDESTFVDGEDGYCVTDGWYGRAGYAECDDVDGLVALIMDIDSAIKFGGIEIVAHDSNGEGSGDIYTFAVQALVDGEWVEVASEEEYLFDATRAYTASFDAVETSKVRILGWRG